MKYLEATIAIVLFLILLALLSTLVPMISNEILEVLP